MFFENLEEILEDHATRQSLFCIFESVSNLGIRCKENKKMNENPHNNISADCAVKNIDVITRNLYTWKRNYIIVIGRLTTFEAVFQLKSITKLLT